MDMVVDHGEIKNIILEKFALVVFKSASSAKVAVSNVLKSRVPGLDGIEEVAPLYISMSYGNTIEPADAREEL